VIIPPANHSVSVYEVTIVTEAYMVDRDIWGDRPLDETSIWGEGSSPTTVYTEIPDPSTIWKDADTHED
jgi:hypothetical protein